MSEEEKNLEISNSIAAIDCAIDVSRGIINVAVEGHEGEPLAWVLLGILAQLDIIRNMTNKVDTMLAE